MLRKNNIYIYYFKYTMITYIKLYMFINNIININNDI